MWDLMNLPTFETWYYITDISHDRFNMELDDMTIHICNVTCYVTSQAMHVKDLAMHASYHPNDLTD